jgi:hypothetical protein
MDLVSGTIAAPVLSPYESGSIKGLAFDRYPASVAVGRPKAFATAALAGLKVRALFPELTDGDRRDLDEASEETRFGNRSQLPVGQSGDAIASFSPAA